LLAAEWQRWSDCDTRCGYGVQVRRREIVVQPQNGGEPCAETVERRLCHRRTHCTSKLARTSRLQQQRGITDSSQRHATRTFVVTVELIDTRC